MRDRMSIKNENTTCILRRDGVSFCHLYLVPIEGGGSLAVNALGLSPRLGFAVLTDVLNLAHLSWISLRFPLKHLRKALSLWSLGSEGIVI